jgi:hypothetical protein
VTARQPPCRTVAAFFRRGSVHFILHDSPAVARRGGLGEFRWTLRTYKSSE